MHSSATRSLFARGFPSALEELRSLPDPTEPDLVLGLFGLLRAAGTMIGYCETDVLSGHATQFLYHREHPECAQIAFVPPTDTLFRALDVTWKEVTPSAPAVAFAVLREWLAAGRVALARFREPLFVYGFCESDDGPAILAVRLRSRLSQERLSVDICDRNYWRYPLDEGNVLVTVESAPRQIEPLSELARVAARRAVRSWHAGNLAGCAVGREAYAQFTADLTDSAVDFTNEESSPWMGPALWQQWTSRRSAQLFFERMAPRFGGADRSAFAKAGFCYGQCIEAWQKWAEVLGPTWDHARNGFPDGYPEDFLKRWRDIGQRVKAAPWVEDARGWEEKAVGELVRALR